MSSASLQDSWLAPVSLAPKALAVSGVPVTGLDAAGNQLNQEAKTQVIRVGTGATNLRAEGAFITYDERSKQCSFFDRVELNPVQLQNGFFSYNLPFRFDPDPPVISVASLRSDVSALVDNITTTNVNGSLRLPSTPYNTSFQISGYGTFIQPQTIFVPPGVQDIVQNVPVPVFPDYLSSLLPAVFTTPADLNPDLPAIIKIGWAPLKSLPKSINVNITQYNFSFWVSSDPSSDPNTGVKVAEWTGVPLGSDAQAVGSESWNQFKEVPVFLEADTTYSMRIQWGWPLGPGPYYNSPITTTLIDLDNIAYHSTNPLGPTSFSASSTYTPSAQTLRLTSQVASASATSHRVLRY